MDTIFTLDLSKVIVTLGNKEFFADHLANIAHGYYLDMLVVYKQVLQNDEDGITTRTISNAEIEEAGLTMEDLDSIARKNTADLLPAVLDEYMGMRVITNTAGSMGASAIMYSSILEKVAEELESDLFLIPSSIHEIIVMPKTDKLKVPDLCEMIREANTYVVKAKDVLSDHPYVYRRESAEIAIA